MKEMQDAPKEETTGKTAKVDEGKAQYLKKKASKSSDKLDVTQPKASGDGDTQTQPRARGSRSGTDVDFGTFEREGLP